MEPPDLRYRLPASWPVPLLVWALGFALFAARALSMGQDSNWDLQNYHDYGAHALLQGRYDGDVGPAGIQGYFNPVPYVIPYLLRYGLAPILATLGLVALQALTVVAAWMLAGALLDENLPRRPLIRLLAVVAGMASAMAISEIGTTFADLFMAAPILLGLLALLRGCEGGDHRLFALAGLLVGGAAGLKLTNFVFAPGLALAILLPWPGLRAAWGATWRTALGGLTGVLLTGGIWGGFLWVTLGNPIFPALNQVFGSPSALPHAFADPRFLPGSIAEAVRYPLDIALGGHPTAELAFRDPRMLLVLLLALPSLGRALRARRPDAAPLRPASPGQLRALVFLLASGATWLSLFSIHRYAVPLDILAGLLLVALPTALLPGKAGIRAGLALALLAVLGTRAPDWFHRAWADAYHPVPPSALPQPATMLVTHAPLGYWVSALAKESRFYGVLDNDIAEGGPLLERIRAGLDAPVGGRIWTLGKDEPMAESTRAMLARHGVVPTGPCLRAPGWWDSSTVFCAAARAGRRNFAAPDLAIGERVDFTSAGSGWIYLSADIPPGKLGWRPASAEGTEAGDTARLVLRPASSAQPRILDFELRRVGPTRQAARIRMLANGQPATDWPLGAGPGWSTRSLCLPLSDPAQGGVFDLYFLDTERPGPEHQPGLILRSMSLREAGPGECTR